MKEHSEKRSASTVEKRSASTDDKYQSTFMPIFSNAEAELKRLIVFAFFVGMSQIELNNRAQAIVRRVKKEIPKDLNDRAYYINGLIKSINRLIAERNRMTIHFNDYVKKHSLKVSNAREFTADVKAAPHVEWYDRKVKKFIEEVNETAVTTSEPGKKSISLWQKAELDVRYKHNMQRINDQIEDGVEYAYISSHADCSKRCEKWQGKLVSLTEHATMSGFRVKKLDGKWVYSLPDIMAQTDKYGYKNNIICGFNCRHHTIPYVVGKDQQAPRMYSHEEVAKQREIEGNIRSMERNIRSMKMKLNEYNVISGKNAEIERRMLRGSIRKSVETYKKYCNSNGYAWYQYRISVKDNIRSM